MGPSAAPAAPGASDAALATAGHASLGQTAWARIRRDPAALLALAFLCLAAAGAVLAPLLVDALGLPGPEVQDPSLIDEYGNPAGPGPGHPLGADTLGRDVASRIIYGARASLLVGVLGAAIAAVLGVAVGLAAGYRRGWVDAALSRIIDLFLCFPFLLLAVGLASACSTGSGCMGGLVKPGLGVVIFTIGITSWTYMARIIRGEVLSLRERDFVSAAVASGQSGFRVVASELLPNLVPLIVAYTVLLVPFAILGESGLSFLGVGIQPPAPSWGAMIAEATPIFSQAWWYMLFPGIALLLTVLALNVLGEAVHDAFDPHSHRRLRG